MTREEAKKYLIEHCNPDYPSRGRLEWDRAMDVAIRALEQDDVIDRVLEIIDNDIKDIEAWEEGREIALPQMNGMLAQAKAFREEVLALKEGEEQE